jgi:hypothetical protein
MLGHSHRLNQVVDSVLKAVYATDTTPDKEDASGGRRRKIVFVSYHPDVCSALNWKQPNCEYPLCCMRPYSIVVVHRRPCDVRLFLWHESDLREMCVKILLSV